jgi:nitrous oxide reductase accessory protein NosL
MTEMLIAGWTSPNGNITIQVIALHTGIFQVREKHHGSGIPAEITPYATEAEARTMARASAEIIRYNQTGR